MTDEPALPPLTVAQTSYLRHQLNDFSWQAYVQRLALMLGDEEPVYVDAGVEDGTASAGGRIVAITRTRIVRLRWDAGMGQALFGAQHTRTWAVPLRVVRAVELEASWRARPGGQQVFGEPDDQIVWKLDTGEIDEMVTLPVARFGPRVPNDVVQLLFDAMSD